MSPTIQTQSTTACNYFPSAHPSDTFGARMASFKIASSSSPASSTGSYFDLPIRSRDSDFVGAVDRTDLPTGFHRQRRSMVAGHWNDLPALLSPVESEAGEVLDPGTTHGNAEGDFSDDEVEALTPLDHEEAFVQPFFYHAEAADRVARNIHPPTPFTLPQKMLGNVEGLFTLVESSGSSAQSPVSSTGGFEFAIEAHKVPFDYHQFVISMKDQMAQLKKRKTSA